MALARVFDSSRSRWLAALLALVAICLLISAHDRNTPYFNDVLLGDAMVHGHLDVQRHDTTIDSLAYRGKNWIIEGPTPAILALPFIAFLHENTNQTIEALLLCLLAVFAGWRLLMNLGVSPKKSFLLLVFFFAGTDLWWCSMLGDVWFIAHTAAVAFTLLALAEAFGKQRGSLTGLWAVLAFGSRFSMTLALPLFAIMMLRNPVGRKRRFIGFAAVVGAGLVLWAIRDYVQYGTVKDLGYTLFFQQDSWGQPTGGPFRLSYLPYELYSFFMQAPVLSEWRQQAVWPIFKIDPHGIALTWTSPALVIAFLAPRRPIVYLLAATVVMIALPSFFYYLDGWWQYGMRHALDFEPFVLVIMALALKDRLSTPWWAKALIIWSCIMGTWGVWFWDTFMRTGN